MDFSSNRTEMISFSTHPFDVYSFCKINNHKKILKFRVIVNRINYGLAAEREIGSERSREINRASSPEEVMPPANHGLDRQGPAFFFLSGLPSGRFVDRPSPAMGSVAAPCSPEI
ncbi:hypothetical protein TIFTF001_002966 [Ficus carica]|uniref:Uncharacterized protein n=1 Tax=Ficus carica TaxID=3494 RepID=A0AA87ZPZ0_FICCA|nr:hypothetical protein TIFTF001_002966 [Ficus carica]